MHACMAGLFVRHDAGLSRYKWLKTAPCIWRLTAEHHLFLDMDRTCRIANNNCPYQTEEISIERVPLISRFNSSKRGGVKTSGITRRARDKLGHKSKEERDVDGGIRR